MFSQAWNAPASIVWMPPQAEAGATPAIGSELTN